MDTIIILIIVIAVIIVFFMAIAMKKMNTAKPKDENEKRKSINEPMPYKLVESIFTKSEKTLFEILNDCIEKKLVVFSKVRLADIAKIENKSSNFQYWFNKIRSKHVDFLICERESGKPILAIELDDYTHNQKDRKERDEFVDQVYKSIELPILHITELNKDKIYQEVSKLI